jgi:hypothetical protein
MLYDVFICHASEDKDDFVRPLAEALKRANVEVWYDEFSLKLGDSIRRAIDMGLRSSRFGVVVISKAFLERKWPQYELDGLIEREMTGEDRVLLPVWYNITHEEISAYSPSLTGRKAAIFAHGLDSVVSQILSVIHPQGSSLIRARDVLLEWGVTPPVITDQYWLDVVEASNRVPGYGAHIPEESAWGRWSFPLPAKEGGPETWGDRLAWTAMQLRWTSAAEEQAISPITRPENVLAFINEHPGLTETCSMYSGLLAEYAPQLTIPGFGGEFEEAFKASYRNSCREYKRIAKNNPTFGSATTLDGNPPLCDEEWTLRSPTFGNYEPAFVAEAYFSGGMFGPRVSPHEHSEHLFWLLSTSSNWLPEKVHDTLLEGMASWGVWIWTDKDHIQNAKAGSPAFMKLLFDCMENQAAFEWTPPAERDVLSRIDYAIRTMGLTDNRQEIMRRFIEHDLVGKYISMKLSRRDNDVSDEG